MRDVLNDNRFTTAAALVLVVYAATLAISPLRVFWTPDEGAKWLEMHSVSVQGDLRYHVDFPAQRVDREFRYLPHPGLYPPPSIAPDGSLYLGFETPVVFPLLSSIGLYLFGIIGIYFIPLVSGWLIALVAGALAAAVHPAAGAPTVLLTGLATPVWFYSVLFWEHTAASCLALTALAAIAATRPWSLAGLLVALLLLLAAATLRLETLAFAASLAVAWCIGGFAMRSQAREGEPARRLSPWAATGYLALLAVTAGAFLFLRASLTVRHDKLVTQLPQRLQTGFDTLWQSPWSILDVFVHTSISEAPAASDAWVLAAGAGMLLCTAAAFARRVRWECILLLPGLLLVAAFSISLLAGGETYRAIHGFVPVAPFVILAPYAWTESRHQGRSYVLLLLATTAAVCCVVTMLAISTIYLEAGRLAVGIEWGQRYMLTLYPVFTALSVTAVLLYWRSARPLWLRRLFVGAVALLVLVAVGFEIRGNGMLYFTRVRMAGWEEAMRREGPIVTDVWWLPASFAIFYTEHEMYYVYNRRDVGDWIDVAASRGIRGFTFVGFAPADEKQFRVEGHRIEPRQLRNVDGLVLTRFVLNPLGAAVHAE